MSVHLSTLVYFNMSVVAKGVLNNEYALENGELIDVLSVFEWWHAIALTARLAPQAKSAQATWADQMRRGGGEELG